MSAREDIEGVYAGDDRTYLQKVVTGRIRTREPELRDMAGRLYQDLCRQAIETALEQARTDGDMAYLEAVRAGEIDEPITPESQETAALHLEELNRQMITAKIEAAHESGDTV